MQRDTASLLLDVREGESYISEDTNGATLESFVADRRMRQLVERNFLTIGEALNRLRQNDPDVATRISDVTRIIGFAIF